MKKYLVVWVFILVQYTIIAQRPQNGGANQPTFEITGKVIDKETKQALEYATIVLTSLRTKKVTGGLTDQNGNFSIEAARGLYDISIEFISFKSYKLSQQRITKNINLGTIALEIDSESLDEVEVIAERTTVEIRLDKKIYNVGKDLTVRGGTVSDVLDNVPSVSVDVEGNVALRGNDNVRILINGKPSGLVGLSSTDALRQLPAEAIEKVEVITSPSARYEAEGTAGILNIILRRSKLQGLNGALTVNGGYPTAAGVSGNLNYRTGDVNFFTFSGYNYREVPGNSLTSTTFTSDNSFIEEDRDFDRIRKGLNTNLGVEWYINKTSSITGSVLFRESDNESNTTNLILQRDGAGLTSNSVRIDPEFEDDKTIQYALNYDKQFEKDGHRLTADFQYEESREVENSLINQDGIDVEKVRTDERQDRILLQTDYVLPLNEKTQLEFGYRGNFNKLDTDYQVDSIINNVPVLNTNLSNRLLFNEYNNAFYSQYGTKVNKLSVLLGLRLETTRITIDQITTNDRQVKEYAYFFPTLNIGYELSDKESLTLGYNRRIRRPRSRFINPFPSRSSATSIFQGNSNLDPFLSDAVDLGYLNRIGKVTLNTSIYYQHSSDVFSFVSEPTGEVVEFNGQEVPVIRRTPLNLDTNDRYGFEFNVTYSPTRKWRANANFNVFHSVTRGQNSLGESLDAENTTWFARIGNKLTLPGSIDWQTTAVYRGPSVTAQSRNQGIFSMNLAFSKDLFKEKASLAFNVSDLLNSRKRISESFAPSFFGDSEFQWRERSFNISFTYRFNQKKKRERPSRSNFDGEGEEFGS